jgi:hypothetical protein
MIVIPEIVKASIDRYVEKRQPVGDFLRAVLSNDLREAVIRADETNLRELKQIVGYCYWEIPGKCWGSPKAYKEWINGG